MTDIVMRTGLALAVSASAIGLYLLYNWRLKRRASGLLVDLGPMRSNAAILLYFTTPQCIPCKTMQRPAIQKVQSILGDRLQVLEVDATQEPDLAKRWGVLSVPTTFLIDSRGQLHHVNHGVTSAEKLLAEFQSILSS